MAVLALVATVLVGVRPAHAAAVVELEGRGFGHGIGMSQYGAQGRATAGQTYQQILAAYYPGTVLTTGSDSRSLRVYISADNDAVLSVRSESGIAVKTASGSQTLPATLAGAAPTQWRIRTDSKTLVLEGLVGGIWKPHEVSAITSLLADAVTADLVTPDGTVQVQVGTNFREYSGAVRAVRGTTQITVVVTTYAAYLPSVVTAEMPSSWKPEALAAQAVAARTYVLFEQGSKSSTATYDTCDSTQCQVFMGNADYSASGTLLSSATAASTRSAATRTAGLYLAYGDGPAFTQFSASNGGYSVVGSRPYLVAAADPYDGLANWQVDLTASQIEAKYPAVGSIRTLTALRDGQGDFGGRVTSITILGDAGSATVTGNTFRSTFALRSTLFTFPEVTPDPPRHDISGDGRADILARSTTGGLNLWNGYGNGRFSPWVAIGRGWTGMGSAALASGITSPGVDLLAIDPAQGSLWAYPAPGNGRFVNRILLGSRGWSGMDAIAGITGFDGAASHGIVTRQRTSGNLYYYASDGSGGLSAARLIGVGWTPMTFITSAGDWNQDGAPDIIARDPAGLLWLYPTTGAGKFKPPFQIGHGWTGFQSFAGGSDWTGDGLPDVLATTATGQMRLYPSSGLGGGFAATRVLGKGWSTYSLVS